MRFNNLDGGRRVDPTSPGFIANPESDEDDAVGYDTFRKLAVADPGSASERGMRVSEGAPLHVRGESSSQDGEMFSRE
jgi:hypothetical protein